MNCSVRSVEGHVTHGQSERIGQLAYAAWSCAEASSLTHQVVKPAET